MDYDLDVEQVEHAPEVVLVVNLGFYRRRQKDA
jgi:hypothetical protein